MFCWGFFSTLVLAWVIVYYIARYLWELLTVGDLANKAVFITGCDTGFGRIIALKCVKNGMPVFAGCLTEKGAKSLEEEANSAQKGLLKTVRLDVTKDDSVHEAAEFVKQQLKGEMKLWAIVNNAGVFTTYGPDDWCTVEDYRFSLDVNTLGQIRVAKAFKPLIKQSKGRIVTVTSVAGRVGLPYAAPYSTAKYASEAYMDCIRQELKPFGVTCCIVEPGVFKTSIVDKDALKRGVERHWEKLSDEQKQEYGEDYGNFFATYWSETFHNLGSPHIEYVIDSYYHAITARYPRLRYRCGWDALLIFVPITYLPTSFVDAVLESMLTPKRLPASIENKKHQ